MILQHVSDLLRRLFRTSATARAAEARERALRLEMNVLRLVGNMPTLPAVATQAMALASDPNTRLADFTRLIEADAAIMTALLRLANSALYSGGTSAVKLPQAVVRLGLFQCKHLILSVSMKSLLWGLASDEKARREELSHHGHFVGCLCRRLNRTYRLQFDGEEFSAGLLHDLGRVLLLLADPECFERTEPVSFRQGPDLLPREREAIGIDHCALGAWFGEHSQLPDAIIQAMRRHHDTDWEQNPNRLAALTAAADHAANHLERGGTVENYDHQQNAALAHLCERWPEGRRERLCAELPAMMTAALQEAALEGGR